MDRAVSCANDEWRLDPRAFTDAWWQIGCAHHQEESDQGRFAFAEHNRAAPDESRICCARGSLEAGTLVLGKDTGEDSTWSEVRNSDAGVVGDVTAQFEATCHLLRMVSFDSRAGRKVRRAAEHEVEGLACTDRRCITKVRASNLVPRSESVVCGRLVRQSNSVFLRFDRHTRRTRKPPRRNHPDRADARTEIEHARRRRRPTRPIPRRQYVVGREAMSIAKLEDSKVPADRIQRLFGGHRWRRERAGWNRARLCPALEMRV